MPRHYYSGARDTTSSKKRVTINWLKENGYLEENSRRYGGIVWSIDGEETGKINFYICLSEEESYINFTYKVKQYGEEDWKEMDYKFNLLKTPCYFGGYRYWFECGLCKNNVFCGFRVGILYLTGDYFGCRHCANLSYESCNESKSFRGYPFSEFTREVKAEELYKTIKREFYNGKPTRKYKQYLKLNRISEVDFLRAELDSLREL